MDKKLLACTSLIFFYPWVLHATGIVVPQALTLLAAILPVFLGSVSLAGAACTLADATGKRRLFGLPLIFIIGLIVAVSFLSVPLGITHLIGSPGILPAAWMVSFLLLAPCSSLFYLSLPENGDSSKNALIISAIISIFALLILLMILPGLLSGQSVLHLLALIWLYGIIGLPLIGLIFVVMAFARPETHRAAQA